MSPVEPGELLERRTAARSATSAALRDRVLEARERQVRRWGRSDVSNGKVTLTRLLEAGAVSRGVLDRLRQNAERLGLSARGFTRCLRVARTIADIEGSRSVEEPHLIEALCYREAV